ncbi:MAG: AAA family ATPase [Pseudomonadota bacterium]
MTGLSRILLTGAACSGKSALVAEMRTRGWAISRDPGARVIRAETATGGTGQPWVDAGRHARLMLKMAVADYEALREGAQLFDRGVLDAALAMGAANAPAAEYFTRYPYHTSVVLAPPMRAIFDAATPQPEQAKPDWDRANADYETLTDTLARLGYRPLLLPEAGIADRADWLAARLADET